MQWSKPESDGLQKDMKVAYGANFHIATHKGAKVILFVTWVPATCSIVHNSLVVTLGVLPLGGNGPFYRSD